MSQEIMNFFNPAAKPETFDNIRISIASPEQIRSWSYGEIKKNRKPLTTGLSSRKRMACSVRVFLARSRTMNVFAANTSA